MAATPRALTPRASLWDFFGAELRHRREAAGWSHHELARRVFVSAALVGKVELAERRPSADLVKASDAALSCGNALTRLYELAISQETAPKGGVPEGDVISVGVVGHLVRGVVEGVLNARADLPDVDRTLAGIDAALRFSEQRHSSHARPQTRRH